MLKITEATRERILAEKPDNIALSVWKGALALAIGRHPQSPWPQPSDCDDAKTVIDAIADLP